MPNGVDLAVPRMGTGWREITGPTQFHGGDSVILRE